MDASAPEIAYYLVETGSKTTLIPEDRNRALAESRKVPGSSMTLLSEAEAMKYLEAAPTADAERNHQIGAAG